MDPNQARCSLSSDKELGPSANTDPDSQTSTASDSAIRDLIALAPKGLSDVFRRSLSRVRSSSTPALVGKEKKSLDLEKSKPGKDEDPRHPGPPIRKPKNILDLQPELQLMIIELLHFGDILRLRQTCKGYRALTSPAQMRALFGPRALTSEILDHCKVCLERDESRQNQLLTTPYDPGYPFSSICIKCALVADDPRLHVGQKVQLGDNVAVWICRWCGWPIQQAVGRCPIPQFHIHCYEAFRASLRRFILLGWIQLSLGIVAAALSWRYFRHAALVFAPTVTSFLLLWFCLAYSFSRHVASRKYLRLLFLELAILGCWIPPVYYISTVVVGYPPDEAIPKAIKASLALFSLNLFFRLINVLGFVVILCGYNLTRRKRPRASWWRKLTYPLMFWLIHWTYPQSVGESGVLLDAR